ncbi:MAG TPA: hypothetical protein VD927_15385 [Chryseosolibacter sp.]|nr:hypothetical protein [Chryseosolibacter sp.]
MILIAACTTRESAVMYNASDFEIYTKGGITTIAGKPANGIVFTLYESGDTSAIASYRNGKLHGWSRDFYPGKKLKSMRYYTDGWKQRVHKGWFEDGRQHFVYVFKDDMFHGNQREWLSNGMMYSDLNYENGQESGAQRVWYPNGKIKTNYIIQNNRRYGLLGTKNCINATDSVFAVR